jgi:hypothetical protein
VNFDARQLDGPAAAIGRRCTYSCVVYLEFIGRQTMVEGGYDHMAMAKHMIVADRIIAFRFLDPVGI